MAESLKKRRAKCISLMARGIDESEIASLTGIDEGMLDKWKADESFMAELRAEVSRLMQCAAGKALSAEISIMEKGGSSALSAAKDILDRSGYKHQKAFCGDADGDFFIDDIPEDIL